VGVFLEDLERAMVACVVLWMGSESGLGRLYNPDGKPGRRRRKARERKRLPGFQETMGQVLYRQEQSVFTVLDSLSKTC